MTIFKRFGKKKRRKYQLAGESESMLAEAGVELKSMHDEIQPYESK